MSDEDILRALRDRAKRDEAEAEKLEAELRKQSDPETDARFTDAILGTKPKSVLKAIEGGKGKAAPAPAPSQSPWRYAPFVAAAAAAAIFFAWPRGAEVPKYALELSGNVASDRADGPTVATSTMRVHREATISIVFRPETESKTKVVARAVLVRDGKAQAWSPNIDVSPQGAVRISGPVKTLFPDLAAPWDVVIVVGPEGAVPSDPQAILSASSAPARELRVARARIELNP